MPELRTSLDPVTDLLVAPCSAKASRYAVMHWHYSKTMPIGRLIRFGVWEDGRFVGSVIYGRGATPQMAKHHKLKQTEFCELVRIALDEHETTVSKIVSETLRQLRETNPGIRLVASFADPNEGHHGGIYQAGNWIYIGRSGEAEQVYFQGRWQHPRNAGPSKFGGNFALALSLRIAALSCMKVLNSSDLVEDLEKEYERTKSTGQSVSSQQKPQQSAYGSSWLAGRGLS